DASHVRLVEHAQIAIRDLGASHPLALRGRANLARSHHLRGAWDKAQQVYDELVRDQAAAFGVDHPDLLTIRGQRAGLLRDRGHLVAAEEAMRGARGRLRDLLGPHHPDVLALGAGVARVLLQRGRHDEAHDEADAVYQLRRERFGDDHPEVLGALRLRARIAFWREGPAAAVADQETAVKKLLRRYGAAHLHVAGGRIELADTLRALRRLDAADALLTKALPVLLATLGSEHPTALEACSVQGEVDRLRGDLDRACDVHEGVLALRRDRLGPHHGDTTASLARLVILAGDVDAPESAPLVDALRSALDAAGDDRSGRQEALRAALADGRPLADVVP
ncbi:MAG: tetratricopeptide repeat protein, partial [Acidobacteriota bacterium]